MGGTTVSQRVVPAKTHSAVVPANAGTTGVIMPRLKHLDAGLGKAA